MKPQDTLIEIDPDTMYKTLEMFPDESLDNTINKALEFYIHFMKKGKEYEETNVHRPCRAGWGAGRASMPQK